MTNLRRILSLLLIAVSSAIFLFNYSHAASAAENSAEYGVYASFLDIPDITKEEIQAIEEMQEAKRSFSYGMSLSIEAFLDENENINGFSALVCDWLTGLFEIPFIPALYEWSDLVAGLASGEIDFTGDMTITEERREIYNMTDAIAERQLIVVRMKNGALLPETTRTPRYVFLEGTTTASLILPHQDRFYPLFADDYSSAYEMLKNGEAEAFFAEGPSEAAFDEYYDIDVSYFFPLVFTPVSLSTQNPELAPIISVVQKALNDFSIRYLVRLYNQGHQEYVKNKFLSLLSDEEREYIRNNPVAQVAAEVTNYPISFYNSREGRWQGIAIDVLGELENLSGIKFEIINRPNEEWSELLGYLETGKAAMITELIYSEERAETFIWPGNSFFNNQFVLISKTEHHNISVNEITYIKVGVVKGTAHGSLFQQWFPDHRYITVFENNPAAFEALERGDIDMMMSSQHQLLNLTNYREQVGYKANFIFDTTFESTFGFHQDHAVLCAIVDKGLSLIDTEEISGHWMRRTFDYRVKLEQQRTILLISASAFFFVLVLLTILFLRKRTEGRHLENLVKSRTEELEEAIVAAENANRTKSSFLASMSHEIRTPMNAIIGMLELLTHEPLNQRQMSYINDINLSATSLLTIINDILDMSKIESGKMELVPVDYDFMALLDNVHSMFTYVSGEKGLDFKLETDGETPHCLFGDDIRLRQVLINICGNAVKFTEKGYVLLKVTSADDTLVFKISDTGRGITREAIENLFNAFQQVDAAKNRGIAGTGLGLAICKSFVEMMGGSIMVESEYGKGTTFIVTVPLIKGDSDKIKAATAPKGRKLFAPKAKVLVVDDNEFNLKVAVGLLSLSKINVETAFSGFLAIEMVQQTDFDIVFMDHMMPEMDGVETTAAIRALGEKYKRLKIVALTANAVQGAKEFFLANDFDDFLSKPIDVRELVSVLEKWLPENLLEKAAESSDEPAGDEPGFLDILNGIEEINVDIGLNSAAGIESLYYEAVKSSCKQIPTECVQMSSHMSNGEIDRFAISVHAMKSILATIGAMDLSHTALNMETAAKNNDAATCEALFPDFHGNLLALHKKLLAVLPAETVSEREMPGDAATLREAVEKALAAARDYDNNAGIAAIEPLLAFDFGEDINTLLETAAKKFSNFDCEKAEETLSKVTFS